MAKNNLSQEQIKEKLDNMIWSFSSVNCYNNCHRGFYLQYIEKKQKKLSNAFAQWGTLGHSILERYYKGEAELWDLKSIYETEYPSAVTIQFPYNKYADLSENYYNAGLTYFENFQGDFEGCEILGVEQKVRLEIDGYQFVGYIDLIVRTPKGIIICDHKSKSALSKKEKPEYLRQLYLYSLYVKEQYGEYPYKLVFNMFRAGAWETEDFNESDLEKAKEWFTSTIQSAYQDSQFKDKVALDYADKGKKLKDFKHDDYFCNYICSTPCLRSQRTKPSKPRWMRGDKRCS